MQPIPPVTILGTGLKECIVAGLLATEGKKVWCVEPC